MRAACAREVLAQPGGPIATQKGYTLEAVAADEDGGGGSGAVMGTKGARSNQVEALFIKSSCSNHSSARGVMGLFFFGEEEV